MRKPIIGITVTMMDRDVPHPGRYIHLNQQYMQAIRKVGGVPILLAGDEPVEEELLDMMDGLLYSGGPDIEPWRYGAEDEGSGPPDVGRDVFELALLQGMMARGKPIAGICRGIQLINVGLGGTLNQDVDTVFGITHPCGHGQRHGVKFAENSFLLPAMKDTLTTNSTHHQSVKDLGEGLEVAAWSSDGLIEAIQGKNGLPIWAVQWHPERLVPARGDSMLVLFKTLVDACVKQIAEKE